MTIETFHWSTQISYPILSALQLLPLGTVLLLWILRNHRFLVQVGIGAALLELLLGIDLWQHYDTNLNGMQFTESVQILPQLIYHAGVDGISVIFILLTGLLTLLIAVYGAIRDLKPFSRLYMVIFAVQSSLMGLFVTLNLLWFVLLSALQIGLIGYLLWRWGNSPDKELAMRRFYQFMSVSILLLIAGTVLMGWNYSDSHNGQWSFNLIHLAQTPVSETFHSVVFFLLFYGLAIRTPLFPLHGWLPLIAEHGNVAIAPTFLLGLKIGIYGLLRFVLPLLPTAVTEWHNYVAAFALCGIFYAAFLAMMQDNLRRLLAYAVISHTGILILGIFSLEHAAFMGSVILSATFGLALAALVFTTGLLYRRIHTTLLHNMGGLFDTLPFLGITFLIGGLAIIGMPGTPGFDATHLILESAIHKFGALVTIASALGNVVAAGFLLWAFQRAFLAPRPSGNQPFQVIPTSKAEVFLVSALIIVLLSAGFYIEPWLTLIDKPLSALSAIYTTH
ncbi:MAG: NADH-quinone oxidoreductase subunit M [Candidatus Thiodiazotropha sp. (ex Lucinoma aequizonata)]|nr:NADH-quinone oxidoreductase subunit M [Candidatus Thiodiazotropha sp. (ex Lucinoma aequizonata)]MCU7886985.1 NADH-quinone oxidoreductase subunit M [Candidatus Thiodiazotropha sp. (ex Lucinoma aequizonata)]MCU7895029.1 NADH-quinone oxidoreductase subunit M [Candidatus Thiodiazotropha sp. (ex Lucinoma aequizonata)]MCU7900289.1 NADH-quinone oxidoreductase subunit M [Candidatus Thiodiazotropha sp. (ex Lucinoma aequizonata)]MCU7902555.1 NADH-quinone oxidoreductase subunit M [Candidatus Thiodiazot